MCGTSCCLPPSTHSRLHSLSGVSVCAPDRSPRRLTSPCGCESTLERVSEKTGKKDAEGVRVHLPPAWRQETPPIEVHSRTILTNIFILPLHHHPINPRPYLITLIYKGRRSERLFLARHPRDRVMPRRLTGMSLWHFNCSELILLFDAEVLERYWPLFCAIMPLNFSSRHLERFPIITCLKL